jgi:type I restriction enzyme, S subunit
MGEVTAALGILPPGWQVQPLKALASHIGSGATPRGGSAIYLRNRISHALVRSQNVFNRFFNEEGLAYIAPDDAASLQGVELQADDILLNITGDGVTSRVLVSSPIASCPRV